MSVYRWSCGRSFSVVVAAMQMGMNIYHSVQHLRSLSPNKRQETRPAPRKGLSLDKVRLYLLQRKIARLLSRNYIPLVVVLRTMNTKVISLAQRVVLNRVERKVKSRLKRKSRIVRNHLRSKEESRSYHCKCLKGSRIPEFPLINAEAFENLCNIFIFLLHLRFPSLPFS